MQPPWAGLRAAALLALILVLSAALLASFGAPRASAQNQAPSNTVWLIPIETEITSATAQFVRARIDRANRERPLALLFVIDTPGGAVPAMQRIVDDILNRTEVPTMAVVRNAFSAGALIAMATEQLAMLPGSAIGAALPIQITPTGIGPVDEKFTSAFRGEFRAVAEARGREVLDLAFAWLLARPQVASVIAGATSHEQVRRNAAAADWQLTDDELAEVDALLG